MKTVVAFFFNVTTNDTYRDLDNHEHDVIDRVTSVTQPESGGWVAIPFNGQGVIYTPPVGFTGGDTFHYVADGAHQATVRIEVTRPVRDDHLYGKIFQDTPNNVANVLENDFLGNGYDGAKLITDVGPTENGGVVTIFKDGKAIFYTPAPGYTGQDRFSYTVDDTLQANTTVNIQALAQHDWTSFCPNPAPRAYSIAVLANDHFEQGYLGPGVITNVELLSGNGQTSATGGSVLLFTPTTSGSHQLRYTVDGQYNTTVSVWIPDHLDPDQMVVDQNSLTQALSPLVNDFEPDQYYVQCKSQDYSGDRLITSATQSQHGGIVSVGQNGLAVYYTPPADFVGSDSFTYTVDDFMTETVNVEVIRRVRDDQFRVDAEDGPQVLPVLVNDLLGADYTGTGQVTGVTVPSAGGTATISKEGQVIVYSPPDNFVGTDTFTYIVDGALKAEVSVIGNATRDDQLPTFESFEAYREFLVNDALARYEYLFGTIPWVVGPYEFEEMPLDTFRGAPTVNRNHSETNVQVAGVDEGDIVEFDSDYLYVLSDEEMVIVDAWPAEELGVASRVAIEGRPHVEYLHGDRLTVISEIGGGFHYPAWDNDNAGVSDRFWPPISEPLPSSTIVTVIDVSHRAAPKIVQTTSMEGRYVDSRGVGDYVYLLVSNDNAVGPKPEIIADDDDPTTPDRYETKEEYLTRITANPGQFVEEALPNYSTYDSEGDLVRSGLLNMPEDIYQPIISDAMNLISVVSLNVESDAPGLADTSGVYSTGASTIYASLNNFYVFGTDFFYQDGAVTRIVKFDWDPESGAVSFFRNDYRTWHDRQPVFGR